MCVCVCVCMRRWEVNSKVNIRETPTIQNSFLEEIKSGLKPANAYLLSFGVESFAIQFVIQEYKDEDIQNYNVACCFAWVSKVGRLH